MRSAPRSLPLASVTLVAVSLAGCFFGGGDKACSKPQEYQASTAAPPFQVPEDLDRPDQSGQLVIPEIDAATAARVDDNPCLEQPPDYFGRPLD